jgi:hypothetical protein
MVEDGRLIIEKDDTLQNLVDALTKTMSANKFKWCCDEPMGLTTPSNRFIFSCILHYALARYMTSGRMLRHVCHAPCYYSDIPP